MNLAVVDAAKTETVESTIGVMNTTNGISIYAVSSHPNHPLGDTAVDYTTPNISVSFLYIFSFFLWRNMPTPPL